MRKSKTKNLTVYLIVLYNFGEKCQKSNLNLNLPKHNEDLIGLKSNDRFKKEQKLRGYVKGRQLDPSRSKKSGVYL